MLLAQLFANIIRAGEVQRIGYFVVFLALLMTSKVQYTKESSHAHQYLCKVCHSETRLLPQESFTKVPLPPYQKRASALYKLPLHDLKYFIRILQ